MNYGMKKEQAAEFEVNSLYEALLAVSDKRKARGKRYALATVLTMSVLAKLGGEHTQTGMADRVKVRAAQLRKASGLCRESMPHAVSYRRVLGGAIDIQGLEQVLGTFFERVLKADEQLATDGKSMRGTIEGGGCGGLRRGLESGQCVVQRERKQRRTLRVGGCGCQRQGRHG